MDPMSADQMALVASAWAGIIKEIIERRAHQVEKGYDARHDDKHDQAQLPRAAAAYLTAYLSSGRVDGATGTDPIPDWPWEASHWKNLGPREVMVETISFLVAEIERQDRLGSSAPGGVST